MTAAKTASRPVGDAITHLLRTFKLPTAAEELALRVTQSGHEKALPVILDVLEAEADARKDRRVQRLRHASRLPLGKRLEALDLKRLPADLGKQIESLCTGHFLDRAVNVLVFGLPGTGKSHAAAAIGHALVDHGRSVLFTPTFRIVQDLLAAKKELSLPRALKKLDAFDLLILDDIGYVQQDQEEIEVLFTLMAERYERKSILITSNLVFSEWDRIFKNPMTTAAAIDRLVHHSKILEFDVSSYRTSKVMPTNPTERSSSRPPQKKRTRKGTK